MAELDPFLTDPAAITERLTELGKDCHLVSPSTNVDAPLPQGCAVSFSFVRVDVSTKSSDVIREFESNGRLVLSAKKVQEIGAAAGISWDARQSGRRDAVGHPHYIEYRSVGRLKHFDGTEREVIGELAIDLRDGSDAVNQVLALAIESGKDPIVEARHRRANILAEAETRSQARAITNGLGLSRDYAPADLGKPFAVARLVWTGLSEDPVVREAYAKVTVERALGAGQALYPLASLDALHEKIKRSGELLYEETLGAPFPHAWVKGEHSLHRIAYVADTHADGEQGGRLVEHDEIMHWIANDFARRECTGAVHAGDVFERASTPRERLAVADWLRAWSAYARVLVIRGNHDAEGDIDLLGRLDAGRGAITAVTRPGVYHLLRDVGCSAAVACLPWPRKASMLMLSRLGDASRGEGDQAATSALRDVLRGLGDELQGHAGPRLFAGHVMMRGSKSGLGQPPLVGCDYELGLEDLALVRASFYGLGHIHTAQEWDVMGAPAAYISSPRRHDFGELDPKGYVVVEFEGSKLRGWERVPTPCAPMILLAGRWDGRVIVNDQDEEPWAPDVRGADVRFRYSVPVDQQEAARARAAEYRDALLCEGALSVKVEAVVTTERRARQPAVAAATNLPDRLERHWEGKAFEPGKRRRALLEKAAALEAEAAS